MHSEGIHLAATQAELTRPQLQVILHIANKKAEEQEKALSKLEQKSTRRAGPSAKPMTPKEIRGQQDQMRKIRQIKDKKKEQEFRKEADRLMSDRKIIRMGKR